MLSYNYNMGLQVSITVDHQYFVISVHFSYD